MIAYFLFAGKYYPPVPPSECYVGGYDRLEDAQKALPKESDWAEIFYPEDGDYGTAPQLELAYSWSRGTGWKKIWLRS